MVGRVRAYGVGDRNQRAARSAERQRALVVGSLARDRIEVSGRTQWCIGGVVWYAGVTLVQLGIETRALTRTSPADKRLAEMLRAAGLQVEWRQSAHTTAFVNTFSHRKSDDRIQRVLALADPIDGGDVAKALQDVDLAYLGPLHPDDFACDVLQAIRDQKPGLVVLDVQGYMRTIQDRQVIPKLDHRLFAVLSVCDVIKASQAEAHIITGRIGPSQAALNLATSYPSLEVVVTCGADGVHVARRSSVYYEPAVPVDVADSTGAGDIFFASYVAKRLMGASTESAAKFAAGFTARRLLDPSRTKNLAGEI